jgi:sugar lactone lactonase YvrE
MKSLLIMRVAMTTLLCTLLVILSAAGGVNAYAADADVLAITDIGDSKLKLFDARTGILLTPPDVTTGDRGLHGPTGVIWDALRNEWIVSNQNVDRPYQGEILRYDAQGSPVGVLVSRDDPEGPLGPQGILLVTKNNGERILFIADQGDINTEGVDVPGKLLAYRINGTSAEFIEDLNPNLKTPGSTGAQFHPRGLVVGPDGYLYVTLRNVELVNKVVIPSCGGSIVRFDPGTLTFKDIFLSNPVTCSDNINDLHRPEGLAFSPQGDLYVTSFRKDKDDLDRILILPRTSLNGAPIRYPLDRIDLYQANESRTYAQALLFGPNGNLYVPISNTGEVRRYNVTTKAYWTFVTPGKALSQPWFLSFKKTNPATLAYGP